MSQVDFAIMNNDFAELKRLWKKTGNYIAGLNYSKYLYLVGELEKSKAVLLELKNNYPHKGKTYYYLSRIEMNLGNYNKAKEYLKKINSAEDYAYGNILKAKIFKLEKNYEEARKLLEKNILKGRNESILELVFLDIHEEKYIDAFKKLYSIRDYYLNLDSDHRILYGKLLLFISKELNVLSSIDDYADAMNTYTGNQMILYDEAMAIRHILRHQEGNHYVIHNPLFYKEIDIRKLFADVKGKLNEENYILTNVVDLYCLYYQGIGNLGQSYLLVITLPNTKDIINMYPIKNVKSIKVDPLIKKRDK